VEVSVDEGRSWQDASLASPVLPKAATRFRIPWSWKGEETTLQSRCTDDTGYVQPTREALLSARGKNVWAHHNGIKVWYVHKDGLIRPA
jgi:sulfane dehydrogenase subunit SoxC